MFPSFLGHNSQTWLWIVSGLKPEMNRNKKRLCKDMEDTVEILMLFTVTYLLCQANIHCWWRGEVDMIVYQFRPIELTLHVIIIYSQHETIGYQSYYKFQVQWNYLDSTPESRLIFINLTQLWNPKFTCNSLNYSP